MAAFTDIPPENDLALINREINEQRATNIAIDQLNAGRFDALETAQPEQPGGGKQDFSLLDNLNDRAPIYTPGQEMPTPDSEVARMKAGAPSAIGQPPDAGAVIRDVVAQIPAGAAKGAINAFDNTKAAVRALAEGPKGNPYADDPYTAKIYDFWMDRSVGDVFADHGITFTIPDPQTVAGGLTRAMSQFMVNFVPYLKAARMAGMATTGLAGVGTDILAGIPADFLAWDKAEGNLTTFLQQVAPETVPSFMKWLAIDEEDSRLEAATKQVLEGAGLGAVAGPLLSAGRVIRWAKNTDVAAIRPYKPNKPFGVTGKTMSLETARDLGLMDKYQFRVAKNLQEVTEAQGLKPTLEYVDDIRLASQEIVEQAGETWQPYMIQTVTGETITNQEGQALNTIIRFYKGSDATTVVEEFAHGWWDNLSDGAKAPFEALYKDAETNLPINEWFAKEGISFFFGGEGMGAIETNVFRKMKWSLLRTFNAADSRKIAPELRQTFREMIGKEQAKGLELPSRSSLKAQAPSYQIKQKPQEISSIETPEFKAWFGASKVVDDQGKPLVVYHGSPDARGIKETGVFKSLKERFNIEGDPERQFFFAKDRRVAASYADDTLAYDYQNAEADVIPAYLSLNNPMEVDFEGKVWTGTNSAIKKAKDAGHDGLIIRNVVDDYLEKGKPTDVYVAFDPTQIKSVNNRGTFDPNDPRISHQVKTNQPGTFELQAQELQHRYNQLLARTEKLLGGPPDPNAPVVRVRNLLEEGEAKLEKMQGDITQQGADALDLSRFDSPDRLTYESPKYISNLNFNRLDTSESIKEGLGTFAKQLEESRVVVSHDETKKLANSLGLTVEQLLARKKGTGVNAYEALAAREMLVSSMNKMQELARLAANTGDAAAELALQKQTILHYAIQAQVQDMTAEVGRALNSFKILAGANKAMMQDVSRVVKAFEAGTMKTSKLADAVLMATDVGQLSRLARAKVRAKSTDMIIEAWINGLLSNPVTHAVNMTSNGLFAMWAGVERGLATGISKLTGSGMYWGETLSSHGAFWGMIQGTQDGLRLAARRLSSAAMDPAALSEAIKGKQWAKAAGMVYREGVPSDALGKIEARRYQSITAENVRELPLVRAVRSKMAPNLFDAGGPTATAIDMIGETVRMSGRFLGAEDEFFKAVGYRMELNALSYRKAMSEALDQGLYGKARRDFVAKRINEILEDPETHAPEVHLAAIDASHYQTFTNELGMVGRWFQKGFNAAPALKVVVPFMRTPVNLVKRASERGPLAIIMPSFWQAIKAGGAQRDMALARMSLGSAVAGVVAWQVAQGNITAEGPAHPGQRKAWLENYQPWSIRIGGHWYSYDRFDPLGQIIGSVAKASEIMAQYPADWEHADEIAGAVLLGTARYVTNRTYLRGVSDFLDALNDYRLSAEENPSRSAGARYIRHLFASTIPASSLMGEMRRQVDPVMRRTDAFLDEWRNRTPGLSADLPARRNHWGEEIKYAGALGPDWLSPMKRKEADTSPVDAEFTRIGYAVPGIARTISAGGGATVKLTDIERDHLLELRGQFRERPSVVRKGQGVIYSDKPLNLKQAVEWVMRQPEYAKWSDGPDGEKARHLNAIFTAWGDAAKAQLMNEQVPGKGYTYRELVEAVAEDRQREFNQPGTAPSFQ